MALFSSRHDGGMKGTTQWMASLRHALAYPIILFFFLMLWAYLLPRALDDSHSSSSLSSSSLGEWANGGGTQSTPPPPPPADPICNRSLYPPLSDLRSDTLTLLVNGFQESRLSLLKENLRLFSHNPAVSAIFLLWGNTFTPPSRLQPSIFSSDGGAPIRVIRQTTTSLNARFLPRAAIETAVVAVCDDDVLPEAGSLEFALKVWQSNRDRIVGFFPRCHVFDETNRTWQYYYCSDCYSMMLTKLMLLSTEYLYDYTCRNQPGVREVVDREVNCEDIAMNFLVANRSRSPPVLVAGAARDWGDGRNSEQRYAEGALGGRMTHQQGRAACLQQFVRLYGGAMPLQYSFLKAVPHSEEETMCDKYGFQINCNDHIGSKLEARRAVGQHLVVSRDLYAYVSVIHSPDLVPAALVLAQSLRSTGTAHHLVLLLSDHRTKQHGDRGEEEKEEKKDEEKGYYGEESRMRLRAHYDSVVNVSSIDNPYNCPGFDKIHAWTLTNYSKVILIDVEMMVLDKLDDLFDRPEPSAAPDIYAPDQFDTGLMVIRPSNRTYAALVSAVEGLERHPNPSSKTDSDRGERAAATAHQGFFNAFFSGWFEMTAEHRLPYRVNVMIGFPENYNTPGWYNVNRVDEYLQLGREALRVPAAEKPQQQQQQEEEKKAAPIRVVHFANPGFRPWVQDEQGCAANVWCEAWKALAAKLEANDWLPIEPPESVTPVEFLSHPDSYPTYYPHIQDSSTSSSSSSSSLSSSSSSSASASASASLGRMPGGTRKGHRPVEGAIPLSTEPWEQVVVTLVTERTVGAAGVWAASYREHHVAGSSWRKIMLMVPSTMRSDLWAPLVPLFDIVRVVPPLTLSSTPIIIPTNTAVAGNSGKSRRLLLLGEGDSGVAQRSLGEEGRAGEGGGKRGGGGGEEGEGNDTNGENGQRSSGGERSNHTFTSGQEQAHAHVEDVVGDSNVTQSVSPHSVSPGSVSLGEEYNVLYLWNLTEWAKVAYVSPRSLFVENVNGLFDYTPFAAAPRASPPDQFSSAVMVVQPSRESFDDLLKQAMNLPNERGPDAEGFLNEYFYDWYSRSSKHRISPSFDVQLGKISTLRPLKILSFSEQIQICHAGEISDRRPFDPREWVTLWRRTFCSLKEDIKSLMPNCRDLCSNVNLGQGSRNDTTARRRRRRRGMM